MGREEHSKQKSLACVGSARSVSATLGLPSLTACALSQSTLLRPQVPLQGNCLMRALGCVHFSALSHSGSGSRVLHQGADLGLRFVPFPGPSSSSDQVLGECTLPRWGLRLITTPVPAAWFSGCAVGTPSQMCCVSPLGS